VGWFIVAAFLTGALRISEYIFPNDIKKANPLLFLFPVPCFFVLFVLVIGIAVHEDLHLLIPIAITTMLSIIFANFYSFFAGKNGAVVLFTRYPLVPKKQKTDTFQTLPAEKPTQSKA